MSAPAAPATKGDQQPRIILELLNSGQPPPGFTGSLEEWRVKLKQFQEPICLYGLPVSVPFTELKPGEKVEYKRDVELPDF